MPRLTLYIILLLSLPQAMAEPPSLAGKSELSLDGNLDFLGPNGDNIDLQLGYGRFLSDTWLIGGELRWSLIEDIAPGENDYRSQQIGLVSEWLFIGESNLVPYVGAEIGFRRSDFNDLDESGLVYGGRAGVRYFLTDSVSIEGSLSLLQSSKDVFIVDFEAEDQYVYPSLGINAVF